jgi:cell division protein FtsB
MIFLVFACVSLSRSIWDSYQKLGVLKASDAEIKKLQAENERLKNEVEYRKTPFYIEKSAREKLGYGKNGETIYVVENLATGSAEVDETASLPNWQRWVKLFF